MTQRQVLENFIDLSKTLRGPAKLFYADHTLPMPVRIEQVLNATVGGAATGWTALGSTRGGVNVGKTLDTTIRDDIDQILGAYAQDITDRSYVVSTQLAEVLDRSQRSLVWEMGTPTVVSTTGATQVMTPLDGGKNVMTPRRLAVVYPKAQEGKVYAFVFRWAELAGGDKPFRFDKNDPASPPLEFRIFPELATTIDSGDAYGREFEHI